MVGALLVRKGRIIAEAWHEVFGGPHAEAMLIKKFDQKFLPDDGLYLNLEPCSHTLKKTPPCTEMLISSGIKRVVIGCEDPNPKVAGRGVLELRANGIEVIGPVNRAACEWLNRGFFSLMQRSRPWVTIKKAQTRGGAIAHEDGSMMKITDADQDRWSHALLRAKHDAILVGVGTALSDDPRLTVRTFGNSNACQPLRIILDPSVRISPSATVVSPVYARGTILIVADVKHSAGAQSTLSELSARGVRIMKVPLRDDGSFVLPDLFRVLTTPAPEFCGITSLLVEGGAVTWDAFTSTGAVDAMVTLVGA